MTAPVRWLTSEQLGPHFDDGGDIAFVEALEKAGLTGDRLETVGAISWGMRKLVEDLGGTMLEPRGFVTERSVFDDWAAGKKASQLVMDRFYREVRERTGLLMEGGQPVGGRFSFDADNRERPPKGAVSLGLPDPWRPVEDDIDDAVRADLDRLEASGAHFIGLDAPRRFAATRAEAFAALDDFVETRLNDFGPYEDAMLAGDAIMAHTRLSVPINLGLLHPMEVVERVVSEHAARRAPLNSVEGLVRQLIGWRDWVWHLYWHLGSDYASDNNFLDARAPVPEDWWRPDPSAVAAACLSDALDQVARTGWTHHILRLMVLGNHALQRGYDPAELTAWFRDAFVDGTAWVMPANVVGMSQFADGGIVATKPYAAGGAYIQKMSDYCGSCPFDPKKRVGGGRVPVHRRVLGVPRSGGAAHPGQPPHGATARGAAAPRRPRAGRRPGASPRALLSPRPAPLRRAAHSARADSGFGVLSPLPDDRGGDNTPKPALWARKREGREEAGRRGGEG